MDQKINKKKSNKKKTFRSCSLALSGIRAESKELLESPGKYMMRFYRRGRGLSTLRRIGRASIIKGYCLCFSVLLGHRCGGDIKLCGRGSPATPERPEVLPPPSATCTVLSVSYNPGLHTNSLCITELWKKNGM